MIVVFEVIYKLLTTHHHMTSEVPGMPNQLQFRLSTPSFTLCGPQILTRSYQFLLKESLNLGLYPTFPRVSLS